MPLNLEYTRLLLLLTASHTGAETVLPDTLTILESAEPALREAGVAAGGPPLAARLSCAEIEAGTVEDGGWRTLPAAILLAGMTAAADLQRADVSLSVIETQAGLEDGGVALIAECATPALLLDPTRFSGLTGRLAGLLLDEDGLATALRLPPAESRGPSAPLQHARARIVLLAADAGVPAFLALPPGLDDPFALKRLRMVAAADGFAGLAARSRLQAEALLETV